MTRPAHILAAAALALSLSGDAGAGETSKVPDVRDYLHGKQREAFECEARVINIKGGRQGGKSYWLAGWLWDGALRRPGSLNCYIALSKESARYIIWPEIVLWAQQLGVDLSCLSEAQLTVRLPNGSIIRCSGTDDKRTIESWRGMKIFRLAIDEMGSQPEDLIKYFIGLLWPTMAKFNGQMARAGTPSVVCSGYWYDQTGPERKPKTPPLFSWTIFDNPGITERHDIDEFLDEMCEDLDIERDSVTYRREILAEWVEDQDDLVFPLGQGNHVDALPTHTDTGVALDPNRWRFVLSEDCGFVDHTAFSLVAAHRDRVDEYVVATEQHEGMLSAPAGDRIREILANEPGWVPKDLEPALRRARLVIDTGGAGKQHAEEIARRTGLHYTPAKKTDKETAMRRTRDRVKAGRTKVLRGKQNDGIRSEWARIMWDKEQRAKGILLPKKGKDHRSDATCYGLRELRHFVKEEPANDTRTEAERTADELMEKRQKRYKRKRRGVVVR